MITREYLIEFYDKPIGKDCLRDIIKDIEKECFPISVLYDISFKEKQKIGFHAAWTIEKMYEKDIEVIDLIIEDLLKDYNTIPNYACARHYGRMLALALKLNAKGKASPIIQKAIRESNDEIIIEGCFKWLIAKDIPIGTKMWQLEILLYYAEKHAWVKEELIPIAEKLLINGTPASINYGKRLLKRLKPQNLYLTINIINYLKG